jgi:hypothetical protein
LTLRGNQAAATRLANFKKEEVNFASHLFFSFFFFNNIIIIGCFSIELFFSGAESNWKGLAAVFQLQLRMYFASSDHTHCILKLLLELRERRKEEGGEREWESDGWREYRNITFFSQQQRYFHTYQHKKRLKCERFA